MMHLFAIAKRMYEGCELNNPTILKEISNYHPQHLGKTNSELSQINFTLKEFLALYLVQVRYFICWNRELFSSEMNLLALLLSLNGWLLMIGGSVLGTTLLIMFVKIWNISIFVHISVTRKSLLIALSECAIPSISIVHNVWSWHVLLVNRLASKISNFVNTKRRYLLAILVDSIITLWRNFWLKLSLWFMLFGHLTL